MVNKYYNVFISVVLNSKQNLKQPKYILPCVHLIVTCSLQVFLPGFFVTIIKLTENNDVNFKQKRNLNNFGTQHDFKPCLKAGRAGTSVAYKIKPQKWFCVGQSHCSSTIDGCASSFSWVVISSFHSQKCPSLDNELLGHISDIGPSLPLESR